MTKVQLPDDKFTVQIQEAGHLAEKYCLVSRSVACHVDYKLDIEIKHK